MLSAAACADVSTCLDRQGGTVVQDGLCVTAIAAYEMAPSPAPAASLRTAKELVAFPAGALYYELVFAYTMTNTTCIRLERTPSAQPIAACLAPYGGALQAPRTPLSPRRQC